jgi:hypothetical protein
MKQHVTMESLQELPVNEGILMAHPLCSQEVLGKHNEKRRMKHIQSLEEASSPVAIL